MGEKCSVPRTHLARLQRMLGTSRSAVRAVLLSSDHVADSVAPDAPFTGLHAQGAGARTYCKWNPRKGKVAMHLQMTDYPIVVLKFL